jgi:hypothetical protein
MVDRPLHRLSTASVSSADGANNREEEVEVGREEQGRSKGGNEAMRGQG